MARHDLYPLGAHRSQGRLRLRAAINAENALGPSFLRTFPPYGHIHPQHHAQPRTTAMASEIADVPAPFTTKLTPQQSLEYRKRKVALISGACLFSHHRDLIARLCLIAAQVSLGRMVHICEYCRLLCPHAKPTGQESLLVR